MTIVSLARAMAMVERYRRFRKGHTRTIGGVTCFVFLALGVAIYSLENKNCESVLALAEFGTLNLSAPLPNLMHISVDEGACVESVTFIDAVYWTIVTISTVGYGDLSPSTTPMRIFAVLYVIIGTSYVFVQLSTLFAIVLQRYRSLVLHVIDKALDKTPQVVQVDSDGDGQLDSTMRVSGRSKGVSGRGIDLSGDGQIDFIAPPFWVAFWIQELVPAVTLWLGLQLIFSFLFTLCEPSLDFGTAFYHCIITASTVGCASACLDPPTSGSSHPCYPLLGCPACSPRGRRIETTALRRRRRGP